MILLFPALFKAWFEFWFSDKPVELPRAQVLFFGQPYKEAIKAAGENINERGGE